MPSSFRSITCRWSRAACARRWAACAVTTRWPRAGRRCCRAGTAGSARSAAAALFEVWFWSHLRPRLLAGALAQLPAGQLERAQELLASQLNLRTDARIELALIDRAYQSPRGAGELEHLLEASLASAMSQLAELLGPDPARWQWGSLHQARLAHPLAAQDGPFADPLARIGSQPRGGNGDTVGNAPYDIDGFAQAGGASMRMVLDVGDWDNSLAMNSPGQSGHPQSPHYADLYAAWARMRASRCSTRARGSRPSPSTASCCYPGPADGGRVLTRIGPGGRLGAAWTPGRREPRLGWPGPARVSLPAPVCAR